MPAVITNLARQIAPPFLFDAAVRIRNLVRGVGFFGDYPDFESALRDCRSQSHQAADILAYRHSLAILARDKPSIDISPEHMPFLQAVLRAVLLLDRTNIRVLDFGGALGTHYFLTRRMLPEHVSLDWTIVDLPATVAAGSDFATKYLHFTDSLEGLGFVPDITVSSGTIHYLPNPLAGVRRLLNLHSPHTILALVPLRDATRDRLTIQKVGAHIATIDNPHWFLAKRPFLEAVAAQKCIGTWRHPEYTNHPDGDPKPCEYFGFHFA